MAAATGLNIIDNHRMNDTGHGNGLTITTGVVRVCLQALAWWPPQRALISSMTAA